MLVLPLTSLLELIINPKLGWGHPAKGATTPPKADNISELPRAFPEESGQNATTAFSWHASSSETSLDRRSSL